MDWKSFTTAPFWNDARSIVAGEETWLDCDCDSSVIFKTSGSTGTPKWIVHDKRALLISAQAVNEFLGVDSSSKWGLALPIDHMGGFAILARVYQAACGIARFEEKWNAVRFSEWLSEAEVTHTSLVPTQVHDLVQASLSAPESLRAVVVGGGSLSENLGQAARDLGWPVLASYGMTEAASQIATQPIQALSQPFHMADMEILSIWQVANDPEGRLIISGDALFKGYLTTNGSRMEFQPRKEQSFVTQDRVAISGNRLTPLGRTDDLVKVLGVLVDLREVERKFLEISAGRVSDDKFAVIALPDARKEHLLVALFEGEISNQSIAAYQHFAPGLEQFDRIEQLPAFPRSSLGKIKRAELAKMVTNGF